MAFSLDSVEMTDAAQIRSSDSAGLQATVLVRTGIRTVDLDVEDIQPA